MDFDLSLLHSQAVQSLSLKGDFQLPKEYYEDMNEIISISDVVVDGKIFLKQDSTFELNDYIDCNINGKMILIDSISLKEEKYPFMIEYHDFVLENWRKNKNTLDIFAFLWENIVLEVPLQFTKVRDLSKFHGDGWKLIGEDELHNQNNPFYDLLKDIEEE